MKAAKMIINCCTKQDSFLHKGSSIHFVYLMHSFSTYELSRLIVAYLLFSYPTVVTLGSDCESI